MKIKQLNFGGGMNLFDPDHLLAPNEYPLAFNVRHRDNVISGINGPLEDTTAPNGLKQGLFGYDKYLFLVNKGNIYYKDTSISGSTWGLIVGQKLSSSVSRVYCHPIPATPAFYGRRLQETNIINGTSTDSRIDIDSSLVISGLSAGLVFQDGVSQGIYVYIDPVTGPTGVLTGSYDLWTTSNRKYLPIGKNLAIVNGILWTLAPDGFTLYRSLTHRYTDFVVNITKEGNKGGDASTTSYAVSPLQVTGLFELPTGQLLVTTLDGCYPVSYNTQKLYFGEPSFNNNQRFSAGVINQYAAIDILEDYLFIDQDGIRSYLSIAADAEGSEGRMSIFSRKVTPLIEGIQQDPDKACAYYFNNYALFSLNTKYGYGVLVYDTIKKVWVSLDRYGIDAIKQFTSTKTNYDPKLYCITEDKVYQMYSGSSLTATLYTRTNAPEDAGIEIKLEDIYAIFNNISDAGLFSVTEYTNEVRGFTAQRRIESSLQGIYYPLTYPIGFLGSKRIQHFRIPTQGRSAKGFKSGALLQWNTSAKLIHWQAEYTVDTSRTPMKQKESIYASNT